MPVRSNTSTPNWFSTLRSWDGLKSQSNTTTSAQAKGKLSDGSSANDVSSIISSTAPSTKSSPSSASTATSPLLPVRCAISASFPKPSTLTFLVELCFCDWVPTTLKPSVVTKRASSASDSVASSPLNSGVQIEISRALVSDAFAVSCIYLCIPFWLSWY